MHQTVNIPCLDTSVPVCLFVHGRSFLNRIFECLHLAIPHSPADSKTIHGQRKGRLEKPIISASSERLPILGSKKKKSSKLRARERRDQIKKVTCLSSNIMPLCIQKKSSKKHCFTFIYCYLDRSFFKTFLTLLLCALTLPFPSFQKSLLK